MTLLLADMRWGRILLAGIAPHLVWNFLLVVSVYMGSDPNQFSMWTVSVLTALLTLLGAVWVGYTVEAKAATLHGVLVGLVSAIAGLPFGMSILAFVLMIAAGWLGGWLRGRLRAQSSA